VVTITRSPPPGDSYRSYQDMSTSWSGGAFALIGQVFEPGAATSGHIEVWLGRKSNARRDDGGTVVYLTKYADGQVGERSIGMSVEVARELGGLLLRVA
jgi:hypothetical protein